MKKCKFQLFNIQLFFFSFQLFNISTCFNFRLFNCSLFSTFQLSTVHLFNFSTLNLLFISVGGEAAGSWKVEHVEKLTFSSFTCRLWTNTWTLEMLKNSSLTFTYTSTYTFTYIFTYMFWNSAHWNCMNKHVDQNMFSERLNFKCFQQFTVHFLISEKIWKSTYRADCFEILHIETLCTNLLTRIFSERLNFGCLE